MEKRWKFRQEFQQEAFQPFACGFSLGVRAGATIKTRFNPDLPTRFAGILYTD